MSLTSRPRRWVAVVVAFTTCLLAASATLGVPAATAATDAVAETRFVDSINAERASRGLSRLTVEDDLRAVARRHAARMADRNSLHHNPNLRNDVVGWTRLAENVGVGNTVASLHAAFMASPGHRANVLDARLQQVGVGVEVRGSRIWVTVVFRTPRSAVTPRFSDVGSRSTHANDIQRLAASGVTMGCGGGRFCPDRPVTRAEMATFLARADALLPRDPRTFGDTGHIPVHEANIEAVRRAGVTNGCGSGRFCPDRAVTRAEMASFLARSLGLPMTTSRTRFADVADGSMHASAIEAIARAGITNGCGAGYCPDRPVTRAEMASFLVRSYGL